MNPLITISHLSKNFKVRQEKNFFKGLINPRYKEVRAVDDISFSVQKGESVAFLGPNGAGKTTTTKMLTGLIYPSSGSISVLGHTPFERKRDFLMRIGLVMGNKAGLNWDLTPRQSFRLLQGIYRMNPERFNSRLAELTSLLQVEDLLDTQLRRLSLGERMKMELIGAILHDPEILFLDEPTIGLDIVTRKNVRNFLRRIQRESGTTLILTSHDMDDIEHVCDRVVVINEGKVAYDDTLKELIARHHNHRFVRLVFEENPNLETLQEHAEVVSNENGTYLLRVSRHNLAGLLQWATNQPQVVDMHVETVPLETIIAELFQP